MATNRSLQRKNGRDSIQVDINQTQLQKREIDDTMYVSITIVHFPRYALPNYATTVETNICLVIQSPLLQVLYYSLVLLYSWLAQYKYD